MKPLIAKVGGFVLLFGGMVFETGLPNLNILAFNISSSAWSILDAEIEAHPELLMLDIKIAYFRPSSILICIFKKMNFLKFFPNQPLDNAFVSSFVQIFLTSKTRKFKVL
jgi:hypothetical protein